MTCHAAQRRRVADAAIAAENLDCVFAVDVIPAAQDPTNHWVLDLLVAAADDRPAVPWQVHDLLADHRLGTHQSGPQGLDYYQVVAVA